LLLYSIPYGKLGVVKIVRLKDDMDQRLSIKGWSWQDWWFSPLRNHHQPLQRPTHMQY